MVRHASNQNFHHDIIQLYNGRQPYLARGLYLYPLRGASSIQRGGQRLRGPCGISRRSECLGSSLSLHPQTSSTAIGRVCSLPVWRGKNTNMIENEMPHRQKPIEMCTPIRSFLKLDSLWINSRSPMFYDACDKREVYIIDNNASCKKCMYCDDFAACPRWYWVSSPYRRTVVYLWKAHVFIVLEDVTRSRAHQRYQKRTHVPETLLFKNFVGIFVLFASTSTKEYTLRCTSIVKYRCKFLLVS